MPDTVNHGAHATASREIDVDLLQSDGINTLPVCPHGVHIDGTHFPIWCPYRARVDPMEMMAEYI